MTRFTKYTRSRSSMSMTRSRIPLLALLTTVAISSCGDGDPAGATPSTALALSIEFAAGVQADQGRLQIEGDARRTVTLSPGETREIELPVGSYTVSLEGLTGGVVTGYYERRNVNVTEGNLTPVTATLSGFVGPAPQVVSTATAGLPITVNWSPVNGAEEYDVEVSASAAFSGVLDQQRVTGTTTQFTVNQTGTVYFRVRPITRFSSAGAYGTASAGTELRPRVESVEITPPSADLEVGQTLSLQATTRGAGGQELIGRLVEWSSDDPGVATITPTGVVTAVALGSATIRATSEGATDLAVINVVDASVATVTVEPVSVTVPLLGTADFVATALTAGGAVIANAQVTWSSADESVATVDQNGRATGIAGGTTEIVATVDGVSGSGSITVEAGQPPQVTNYDVAFAPVNQGCGVFQDFRTSERLDYFDPDGNMNPFGVFTEPTSSAPVNIDSQWREEGATVWKENGFEKTWDDEAGSGGTNGGLRALGTSCWRFTTPPTYMDFRVRIRDANGNWSAWFEIRRKMPASVVLTPADQFALSAGGSQQMQATALDEDGAPVPGDPINWSVYTGDPYSSITPTGLYSIQAVGPGGLDHVAARAGYVYGTVPVQGPFADGSWFAPGWRLTFDLALNASLMYMVKVYEGREYAFRTAENPSAASSGDLDLYIKFNGTATTTDFDAQSAGSTMVEEIVWTAPADGTVSVLLFAFSAVTGAELTLEGSRVSPRANEAIGVSGADQRNVIHNRDDSGDPVLLPPAIFEWRPRPPTAQVVLPGGGGGSR